jgi:hypothetical protein
VVIAFTAPDDASSVTFEALAHSTNSHLTEEDDKDSTLSTWEVWQLPDPTLPEDTGDNKKRRVGSGELPIMAEDGADYAGSDADWEAIVIPVTGSLVAGAAELRLLSGHNPNTGAYDDYEVKSLNLIVCGVGIPDLPNEGGV